MTEHQKQRIHSRLLRVDWRRCFDAEVVRNEGIEPTVGLTRDKCSHPGGSLPEISEPAAPRNEP